MGVGRITEADGLDDGLLLAEYYPACREQIGPL